MQPIHLVVSQSPKQIKPGASHFWGDPDLPRGMDFPTYIVEDGEEYHYFFICQLNLEDIAIFDKRHRLPPSGLLLFFAKIDRYMGLYDDSYGIGGSISSPDAVKVLFFPRTDNLHKVVLVDDDNYPIAPEEIMIEFSNSAEPLSDEHFLFADPTHREWETWEHPFEDWEILLQIDSFEGKDFVLNFMDFGVLDILISPDDLKNHCFDNVRAVVLST